MAEHIYMTGRATPEGRTRVKLLYVFDIAPRIKDAADADVVRFNSANIPAEFQVPAGLAERALIDAGDAGYVQTEFDKTAGETAAAFAARAWLDFDEFAAYVIARQRDAAVEAGAYDRQRAHVSR